MKKFKFLAVVMIAFLMIIGSNLSAQKISAKVTPNATLLVSKTVSDLKKKAVGGNELGDEAERTAVLVHSLKIEIGTRMLEPLKSGAQVERALAEATEVYRTQHLNAFRSAALNEAETFYKDLLKDYK